MMNKKRSKATAFLYIGLAVLLVLLNLYAYLTDTALAGIQMPQIVPKLETAVVRDTATIEYFPRNLILVQLAVIVLSLAYMKLSSKEYNVGLSLPEHKVGFVFSIIAMVVAVVYTVIQLTWKASGYWHIGMVILLSVIANGMFIALGVYMFRKAGMGRVAKLLIPFISGAVLMAVAFYYEAYFINTFLYPYPFITLNMSTIIIFAIVAAVLVALFNTVFYLKTHQLSTAIFMSLIWSVAVTSYPLSSMATQAPLMSSDLTAMYLNINDIEVIKSYGFTEVVALLGTVAIVATTVALLVSLLREKGSGFATDEVAGYVPLDPSADEITDCKSFLRSPKTLLLAVCSVVVLGFLAFSVISDHAVGVSDFVLNGFDGLFNENVGDFFLLLAGIIGLAVALALLGSFVIAFFLFNSTRKISTTTRKSKAAWVFVKIFVIGSIALDLIVAVSSLFGFGRFLAELPEDLYIWNNLTATLVALLNNLALSGAIPSIVLSLIVVVLMLIFGAYHTASLFLVLDFEKNNGETIRGKFLYKTVYVMTLIFAALLMLAAPWFYQVIDACVALLAGATMLVFAGTLKSIAK